MPTLSLIYLGTLAGLILWTAMKGGGRQALWLGWAVGMYLCTVRRTVTDLPIQGGIDSQTLTILALGMVLLTGGPSGPYPSFRTSICDCVMIFIYVCFNSTIIINGQYGPSIPLVYAEYYVLPYFLGRIYLRSEKDLPGALRPLCMVIAAFVAVLVFQAVTSVNLVDLVAGLPAKPFQKRNGFYRGQAGFHHPDSAGMLLLASYPMAVAASWVARARAGPSWWKALPWVVAIGALSTNARGAWAGMLVAIGVHLFFVRKPLRVPLAAVACLVLSFMVFAPQLVQSILYTIGDDTPGGEAYGGEVRTVVIDGTEYVYTGTDHRWLLGKVYAQPLRAAGWFGFGYVPGETLIEENLQQYFWSCDDCYVLLQLQFGLFGLWSFLLLAALVSLALMKAAWSQRNPITGPIASAMISSIIGGLVLLRSVALLNDMRIPWFFTMGLAVSLGQICRRSGLIPAVPTRPTFSRSSPPNAWAMTGGRPVGHA